MVQYYSALPLNILSGVITVQGTAGRPTVDGVLTRNANFGAGAYPTAPSSTFGQATGVADPRVAQLALRVKF